MILYFVELILKKCLPISFVITLLFSVYRLSAQQPNDSLHELTDTTYSVTSAGRDTFSRGSALAQIDSLVQYAYSFLGNRYRRGGITSKGFDCSGYTMTVFKKFSIRLPHTSAGQGLVGIEVNRANVRKGDLILFRGRDRRSRTPGHVGIVISERNDPVRFIHSSTSEGVRIDRLEFEYYRKRFIKVVRA